MNRIQKYFRQRENLINQYIKGDMTKREYLQANLDAVLATDIKPFKNIDTVEKSLFNYQYFNAMAKSAKAESFVYSDRELQGEYNEKSNYYYGRKDRATLAVLRLIDFKDVEAYFISVRSHQLKAKLFEIVLSEHDVILHSTSDLILKLLREEGVFQEHTKKSLIDYYVNDKYVGEGGR